MRSVPRIPARMSRLRVWSRLATLTLMTFAGVHAQAQGRPQASSGRCDQAPVDVIPSRASGAPAGREFARQVESLSGLERDAQIRSQLLSGNVPQFLRRLAPVTVSGQGFRPPGRDHGLRATRLPGGWLRRRISCSFLSDSRPRSMSLSASGLICPPPSWSMPSTRSPPSSFRPCHCPRETRCAAPTMSFITVS